MYDDELPEQPLPQPSPEPTGPVLPPGPEVELRGVILHNLPSDRDDPSSLVKLPEPVLPPKEATITIVTIPTPTAGNDSSNQFYYAYCNQGYKLEDFIPETSLPKGAIDYYSRLKKPTDVIEFLRYTMGKNVYQLVKNTNTVFIKGRSGSAPMGNNLY